MPNRGSAPIVRIWRRGLGAFLKNACKRTRFGGGLPECAVDVVRDSAFLADAASFAACKRGVLAEKRPCAGEI
jgi:hypothetical protein